MRTIKAMIRLSMAGEREVSRLRRKELLRATTAWKVFMIACKCVYFLIDRGGLGLLGGLLDSTQNLCNSCSSAEMSLTAIMAHLRIGS
jgi:hypothetical protein